MQLQDKMTIIQEFVPGKQITLCHIIANPGETLYYKLGLDPKVDYSRGAIGVLTVIPYESAVIAADIAMKSSGADVGFVDRFTGTLISTASSAMYSVPVITSSRLISHSFNTLPFSSL